MVRAVDVAAYALNQAEFATTMKLQKIVYYAQAEHLYRFGEPFFQDRIEAWVNGPVIPSLFEKHRGKYLLEAGFFDDAGDTSALSELQRKVVEDVVARFKGWTGEQVRELVHSEAPWKDARGDLPADAISRAEITVDSMREFYSHGVTQ